MADESAELVGGIEVSVGATHAKLISDLEAANRLLDQWSKQTFNVRVGAGATAPAAQPAQQAAAARPVAPPPIRYGAAATTQAQAGQGQTALQRAINAELAKTGEIYDANTGEAVSATRAVRQQRAAVVELQQAAAKNVDINFDTGDLQKQLDGVLGTLREITAEAAKLAEMPTTPRGSGNRGGRRRAATAGDDEGTGGNQGGRVGILRQPRTSEYEGGPFGNQGGPIQYARPIGATPGVSLQRNYQVAVSPQQRAAEREARERARADEETVRQNAQQAADAERAAREAFLAAPPPHGYDEAPGSATFAPQRRAEEQLRSADQNGRGFTTGPGRGTGGATSPNSAQYRVPTQSRQEAADRQRAEEAERLRHIPPAEPYRLPSERPGARGAGRAAGEGFGAAARRQSDADLERQAAERLAVRNATQVSAGRTARTGASSLGGFLFGGGRERIKAEQDLSEAIARRKRDERDVAEASRLANRPEITANVRARRDAVADLHTAQQKLARSVAAEGEAREKVEAFSSLGSGARNLVSVTAAGAAFGIGLTAVSVALKAAEKAATPYFDQASGYAQKTADLTGALADQARQMQGNAQGVTAVRLAQAGFAASTAQSLQPVIAQRVQVEAGNKALVEQIETFRIAENLRKQSSTAGIGGGGTGGVLGSSLFGIPSTGEQVGNFLDRLKPIQLATPGTAASDPGVYRGRAGAFGPPQTNKPDEVQAGQEAFTRGLTFINQQLAAGGKAGTQFSQSLDPAKVEQTASAFDALSPEMAKAIRDTNLYSAAIAGSADPINAATDALKALNLAGTLTGRNEQLASQRIAQQNAANSVDALRSQFAYERPATLGRLQREQDFQIGTQIPAQAALANLAAPPTPVGTGIVARNSTEQAKINAGLKEAGDLQSQLNSYYAQGFNILRDTYQVPVGLLTQIQSIGSEIASTQAGIANSQSKYQVAQINFQLQIARRTLSDINGLTGHNFGGGGQSYLGRLERENLALGRQGQLLQFALSQRQLNFQQAVAGFTVPGLTPAEQNARVEEARIETSYAQKQLDIQKQMFGNQVQIVDISNLRQGADLAKQIGLLLQGRELTINTALAQQKLARLEAQQQILVQEAGTYITKVNAQVAGAMSEMESLEKATGKAISRTEQQGIAAAYSVGRAFFVGISGGFLGGGSTTPNQGNLGPPSAGVLHASGGVFNTSGRMSLGPFGVAGEAGGETVAILAHPQALSGTAAGGGGNTYVTFGDVQIRTEADFQRLYRMVLDALGREASTKGLRTPF